MELPVFEQGCFHCWKTRSVADFFKEHLDMIVIGIFVFPIA